MRNLLFLLISIFALSAQAQAPEPGVLLTKSYRTRTGQGYTRQVERYYFGPRHEAAELFRRHDHRKGINHMDYRKYPKASFYADGVFTMPVEKKQMARELFRPLLDSVLSAADAQSNRRIEILIYGYTDEAPVDYEGPSYKQVCSGIQREAIGETEYRNGISYLRAADLAQVIRELIEEDPALLKRFRRCLLDLYIEGRGIEYPDPTRQYEDLDDKRKIVKVFWSIKS